MNVATKESRHEREAELSQRADRTPDPDDRRAWDEFTEAATEYNELHNQERMFGQLGPEPPRELGGVG